MESPTERRPLSRASSLLSEGGSSSRTLAQEIEHIKSLVVRASSEASISAQIFRLGGASQHPVTQSQVLHELDVLKRKIKHGGDSLTESRLSLREEHIREPDSQSDSSDGEDEIPDGRDEELAQLAEELEMEKSKREHWVEDAEARIDRVMGRKDEVEARLRNTEGRLIVAQKEAKDFERALEATRRKRSDIERDFVEARAALHRSEAEAERRSAEEAETMALLEAARQETAELKAAQKQTQSAIQRERSDKDRLETTVLSLQQSLNTLESQVMHTSEQKRKLEEENTAMNNRVRELQESRDVLQQLHDQRLQDFAMTRDTSEEHALHLQKALDDHKAFATQFEVQLERLQNERMDADSAARVANETISDLRSKTQNLELAAEKSRALNIEHERSAESTMAELTALRDRHSTLMEEHKVATSLGEGLREQLSTAQQHAQELRLSLTERKGASEAVSMHLHDLQAIHNATVKSLRDTESKLESIRDELRSKNTAAETAREKYEQELKDLEAKLASQTHANEKAHADAAQMLMQLNNTSSGKEKAESQVATLTHELQVACQATQDSEHSATEAQQKLKAKLTDLAGRLAMEVKENRSFREQSQKAEQLHRVRTKDFEAEVLALEEKVAAAEKHTRTAQAELQEKVDGFDAGISDIAAKLQLAEQQLASQKSESDGLTEENKRLADALETASRSRSEICEAHELAQSEATAQQEKVEALEKMILEKTNMLEQLKVESDDAVANLKSQHAAAIDSMKMMSDEEATHVKAETDAAKALLRSEHDTALRSVQEAHKAEVAQLRDDHSKAVDALQARHRAELEKTGGDAQVENHDLRQAHSKAIDELQAQHRDETYKFKTAVDEERRKAEDDHARAVKELETTQDHRVQDLAAEHVAAIVEMQTKGQAATDVAHQKHTQELEHELALKDEAHASALKESDKQRAVEAETLRQEHAAASQKLRDVHQAEIERASSVHAATVAQKDTDHEQALSELTEDLTHKREAALTVQKAELEEQHEATLTTANLDAERQLTAMHSDHNQRIAELQAIHRDAMDEAVSEAVDANRMDMCRVHDGIIGELRRSHTLQLQAAEAEGSQRLEDLRRSHEAATDELKLSQFAELGGFKSTITELEQKYERESVDRTKSTAVELTELREQHERALAAVKEEHETSFATKLAEMTTMHETDLRRALDEARVQADAKDLEAHRLNIEAMRKALEGAKEENDATISNLREAHRGELDRVRSEMDHQLQAKVAEFDHSNKEKHAAALGELRRAADRELLAVHDENEKAILETRSELAAQITAVKEELDSATTAMQRMQQDHANARRNLEEQLAQQTAEACQLSMDKLDLDQRLKESQESHATLSNEMEKLKRQLEDLRQATEQAESVPGQHNNEKVKSKSKHDLLKSQLTSLSKRFGSQHSNTKRDSPLSRSAASDSDINGSGERGIGSFLSRQFVAPRAGARTASRPSTAASSVGKRNVVSPLEAIQAGTSRPATAGPAGQSQSFERYLQQAEVELAQLGSVITANEALFAQKIQEHVGDLQRAKDSLAQEYDAKFNALLNDRNRKDKEITASQAAEFVKEREYLIESFDKPTSTPLAKRHTALKSAEERLVAEHNRRISKRRSLVHLQHAEEFQSLTLDYNAKIGELMSSKVRLEADLSVQPDRFEHDFKELDALSSQLRAERANSVRSSPRATHNVAVKQSHRDVAWISKPFASGAEADRPTLHKRLSASRLPKRVSASPPTPPNSAAQRAFYPGGRNGATATAQPRSSPRSPRADRQASAAYPTAIRNAALRAKTPTDDRRNVIKPSSSEPWVKSASAVDILESGLVFGPESPDAQAESKLRPQIATQGLRETDIELQKSVSDQKSLDGQVVVAMD